MARSERQPSRRKPANDGLMMAGARTAGAFVGDNPVLVGGATAFLVAMCFVTANAVWYQPHAHSAPLFSTRDNDYVAPKPNGAGATTIVLQRVAAPRPSARPQPPRHAAGDATLKRVQSILKDLGYYNGEVDGVAGPATATAITAYQRKLGLPASGKVDKRLLSELGAGGDVTGSIKQAEPKAAEPAAPRKTGSEALRRVQNALRVSGFADVSVDGVMGPKTSEAIRRFQARHSLEQTGEADASVYATMLDLGLLDAPVRDNSLAE